MTFARSISGRELLALVILLTIFSLGAHGGWMLWHHKTDSAMMGLFRLSVMSSMLCLLAYLSRKQADESKR